MIALLLIGCGGPPTGIPDAPGPIDAAVLPDLISIGSPDLPFLLWLTPTQLAVEDWRECPSVFLRDGGVTAQAGDCIDSGGTRWYGSVSLTTDGERDSITFNEFGADNGIGGWVADGTLSAERTPGGTGYILTTDVAVVSLAGGVSNLFWAKTESAYTTYDSYWYADRHDGTVGIQDWGTATVASRQVPLAFVYDCGWAAHTAGTMNFQGSNAASVQFYQGFLDIAMDPPATDTADTGSGADTSETGDTGGDTDRPDFDDDDDPDGACGVCREAEISGTPLEECLDLTRTFSWPFPAPF
jgi:hypothetical protein